jgi:hypothetical protein
VPRVVPIAPSSQLYSLFNGGAVPHVPVQVPKGRIFLADGLKKVHAFPDEAEVAASDSALILTDSQSIIDSL